MDKIRTIIVDDEPEARAGLEFLLEKDSDLQIMAICKDGIEAIDAIRDHHPDLLLLDIQMPGLDGFEVINNIPPTLMPLVIFVTAYDQYAIQAFEIHAFDYLLKPFTDERLQKALVRAKDSIGQKQADKIKKDLEQFADKMVRNHHNTSESYIIDARAMNDPDSARLIFKSDGKVHFLKAREILMIEAFDYYIKVHVRDRFYLVRDSMKNMEKRLHPTLFKRIHKSYIINCLHLQEVVPLGNNEYQLIILGKDPVKSGRSYAKTVQEIITS